MKQRVSNGISEQSSQIIYQVFNMNVWKLRTLNHLKMKESLRMLWKCYDKIVMKVVMCVIKILMRKCCLNSAKTPFQRSIMNGFKWPKRCN